MKKIIALMMAAAMMLSFAACTSQQEGNESDAISSAATETETAMTYDEYVAAELESEVVVETYVQAKQGWWEKDGVGVATFYTQDEDGAYFIYEMPCSKEDYDNKLVKGAKILVKGYKAEWSGEVEIIDATYEVLDGNYVAEPVDLTEKLGTDDLIKYQNQFAAFKGMTVEKIEYKNGEPGDDIYVTLGYKGASYSFCVEAYLTGADTDVYKAVGALKAGDMVDVEGYAYWYEGINTHITNVTVLDEK